MATEIDPKKVTKLAGIVKKEPGNSERYYSEKSGIPMNQILRYIVLAELEADPKLKLPATGPAIAKAREQGVRWPRIAARTGLSEAKAKELFEAHTGTSARDSYTGRGRNFSGTASTPKSGTSSRGTSGRRGAKTQTAGRGTSGRKTSTAKSGTAKSGTARGRGTRAQAASDPK